MRRTMNHSPTWVSLPRGVGRTAIVESGLAGDRLSVSDPTQTILFFPGGGYIAGVARTYHNLGGRLAKALSAEVYLPRYPLAPEAPFPAAHDHAVRAYRMLLDEGIEPGTITLAGDSAGGGLALATLLAIKDHALPKPRCGVLLSPWTDLTCSQPSVDTNDKTDVMLSAPMIRFAAAIYLNGADPRTPYASPYFGNYHGLPPLLLTACEHECLYDDSRAVVRKAREAGVPVELITEPDLLHVWPVLVPSLPEARRTFARLVDFIRDPVPRVAASPEVVV
jgi:monoterpene epsilon-lactone hydrolase